MIKFGLAKYNSEDESDYWAVKGWTRSIKKMNITCDVCFFGHSQIYYGDFQKYFPKLKIIELGYPGQDIKGMLMRTDQIKDVHPKKIFIMAGVNSLWYTKHDFEESYERLINKIRSENRNSQLYVLNILPECDGKGGKSSNNQIIRERNYFIKKIAEKIGIECIDLYTVYADRNGQLPMSMSVDGLHLKPNAHSIMYKELSPYIQ